MIETGKLLQQRYRIDRQIGQGGMGAVYVATDERFGSTVAIKETLCMDDNYRKAIEREARLLNSLKHPALPGVSDHFLEENGQFLVMEYIPGEDLFCILEHEARPFPVETVMKWADQLLDALDYLHNQVNPVIHRDIKPQNLKLTSKGDVVLLDFGLAKGNPTDAANQTAAKSIFGYSRNYASLEQIQGTGTDPRSDLYSLAATLYHLLTNSPPEDALTRAMAVLSNQADPLTPANSIEPAVPAGVAAVLYRAMDLNAGNRPSTAREMQLMLREHESYAGLTVAAAAGASRAASIHDQQTRLMAGTTRAGSNRDTGSRSGPSANYDSDATFVRNRTSNSGKKRTAAVAAAAAVLLAGSAAAGVYLYRPAAVRPPVSETPTIAPEVQSQAAVPPPESRRSGTVEADPNVTEPVKSEEPIMAPRARNSVSKGTRAAVEKKKSDQQADNSFSFDGKTVWVGNVKVKDGRIFTPDTVIDENGVRRRFPRVRPIPPRVPKHYEFLTPEQIRKLEELKKKGVVVDPKVAPKPTP